MKKTLMVAMIGLAVMMIAGCRRSDVREMTVETVTMTEQDKAKIVEALAKYNGVDKTSYQWDMAAKKLTLKYDSMQIAQSNIRYAIDEKGVKVVFPKKTDNHAGY